jgi:heparanase
MQACKSITLLVFCAVFAIGSAKLTGQNAIPAIKLSPQTMDKVGTIDERFQSYNIEAVEVTGGRFWKPYASAGNSATPARGANSAPTAPGGMDPSLYEYRSPIDLSNAKLRKLAAALGPAYLRVSGTWMNATYFQDTDDAKQSTPPIGFNSVLTRRQWKGVVDFSKAVDAPIVTSFAISPGTHNAEGIWSPDEARKIANYTKSIGGNIAAAEFMNEPTFPDMGSAPKGYDSVAYARDFAVFRQFAAAEIPSMMILGPGGVGEGSALLPSFMRTIKSDDILSATGPSFTAFSYHFYGAASHRCGQIGGDASTTSEAALSDEWLGRAAKNEAYYAAIRDRGLANRPIWVTETAQAACGGDRWSSTFLDTFRYLNQLGSLAKTGVQVHMHNTLAASDYGLLDEKTYEPRPNYWAALVWRKLMGNTVLNAGPSPASSLHLYAQCLRDMPGGVALLVINADKNASLFLEIPMKADRYTLTAAELEGKIVALNGTELRLGVGDSLPALKPQQSRSGKVTFAPASITFLAFPKADNPGCR